jgi:predicted deacylase
LPTDEYPIELMPPDISAYRGNTGVDYVTTFDSGRPGPHVLVTAVTHGNELCGAIALDYLFRSGIKPVRGKLTLAFDNVAAYHSFDPARPSASRFIDEDFNRVWDEATLDGPRQSVELKRARELRPVVASADFLLDIHSMQHATAALMLAGLTDKSLALAKQVGVPEIVMRDAGHAAGRRMRDFDGFGDPASPKNALLVECGQHWEKRSADVAIETMLRFLLATAAVDRDVIAPHLTVHDPSPQRVLRVTEAVTIESDNFTFAQDFQGLEVLREKGALIGRDGAREVRTPYADCVLVMPSRRLARGQTAVRLGRYET